MKTKFLSTLVILIVFCFACEKDDSGQDNAKSVAGTYTGTIVVTGTGSASCTSVLTRSSNDEVNLKIKINTSTIPLDGITVTSSGTDSYDLNLEDSSGSFEGSVEGDLFTWTLSAGEYISTFSGSR